MSSAATVADDRPWMNATEAARVLQVSRATLYAYVSRGLVRSQAMPGTTRERGYSRDDVERLRKRTEERRDPDKAAARALQWGLPILESSIALIDGDRLYYRGHDAVTLAQTRSIEEVASLIWTGGFERRFDRRLDAPLSQALARPIERSKSAQSDLPFIARAQAALAHASAHDPRGFDGRTDTVASTGWQILHLLARTVIDTVVAPEDSVTRREAASAAAEPTIDRVLARAWNIGDRGADLLRAALILCADHELNVSAFTARCVASAGSTPYAVIIAGLAALDGVKHGGATARAESMLDALRRTRDLRRALAERLRRGEAIQGFGHPLYRHGDPRAAALLDLLRDRYPKSPDLAFSRSFMENATLVSREHPNLDFALAVLARVLRLPPGSPLALFALGRTIGWIGHAIEQYATGQLIRPRAKYVGPLPTARTAPSR